MSKITNKNRAAVYLGRKRWENKTEEQKRKHALMMLAAKRAKRRKVAESKGKVPMDN